MKPKKEQWLVVGGVSSAILASLCCLGPLLALGLGVGGLAAASQFEAVRPYFMAATIGLFAVAWYLIYRRPRAACATTECARVPTAGKGTKIAFWTGAALALPAVSFSWLVSTGRIGGSINDACCPRETSSAVACADGSCKPAALASAGATAATLKPWEPVDKVFAACAGACGTKATEDSAKVAMQPGAQVDRLTYCPVSGVVFRVRKSSPNRAFGATPLHFCCETCAAYFSQNAERIAAARGLAQPKS